MSDTTVAILGEGRMAKAYRSTLEERGIRTHQEAGDAGDILMSSFSGAESLATLARLSFQPGARLVDLTTQSVADALRIASDLERRRVHYLAGGVTGGLAQVGTDDFRILIASAAAHRPAPGWLFEIGAVTIYDDIAKSVGAKLLHNVFLVYQNYLLGAMMEVADQGGIDNFLDVLCRGTAGRPIDQLSAARDRINTPVSSYTSQLVAKDLAAAASSFPSLATLSGIDIRGLWRAYAAAPPASYTVLANQPFGQHPHEAS